MCGNSEWKWKRNIARTIYDNLFCHAKYAKLGKTDFASHSRRETQQQTTATKNCELNKLRLSDLNCRRWNTDTYAAMAMYRHTIDIDSIDSEQEHTGHCIMSDMWFTFGMSCRMKSMNSSISQIHFRSFWFEFSSIFSILTSFVHFLSTTDRSPPNLSSHVVCSGWSNPFRLFYSIETWYQLSLRRAVLWLFRFR